MDCKHRDETCLSVLATSLQNSDCRIIMINDYDLRADACVLRWKCFTPSGQIRSMLGQIRSVLVRFGKLQDPDTGAVLGTSDLRHLGTVPNAGRISGCYRPNHFLRVTARVIVQSNKTHYVSLLTKSAWYWLPRGDAPYRPTIGLST